MIVLRDYQKHMCSEILEHILSQNILAVLPTGGGKTVIISEVIRRFSPKQTAVIAHRKELITQMSMALARCGIYHRFIASRPTISLCVDLHMREFGQSFYNDDATCTVISVDTIVRRELPEAWKNAVKLWVIDEAHHVLTTNKWGKALSVFPNAAGVGFTATPCRADKKPLGGVFKHLVVGPTMRELINQGYLSDYKIFAPPADLDLNAVKITASGDYNLLGLDKAVSKSSILGDAVKHFKEYAGGAQGITFCVSVDAAEDMKKRYIHADILAEVVTAKTPDKERNAIIQAFREGHIQQLVNVSIFDEGFDVPAVTCVSMLRPTASYNLFSQQFGRALRVLKGKSHAVILDHVGNVHRHGFPDTRNDWTLDAPARNSKHSAPMTLVKVCEDCCNVYERFLTECPRCGAKPSYSPRPTIDEVSGSLEELHSEDYRKLELGRKKIDMSYEDLTRSLIARNVPRIGVARALAAHRKDKAAQYELRSEMYAWIEDDGALTQSHFYLKFNVDWLTAQGLRCEAAKELCDRVRYDRRKRSAKQDPFTSI